LNFKVAAILLLLARDRGKRSLGGSGLYCGFYVGYELISLDLLKYFIMTPLDATQANGNEVFYITALMFLFEVMQSFWARYLIGGHLPPPKLP
jgi:hypothetical protein